MAYDVCILKGPRGRCASWPILDPSKQIHPGLSLGGGGNGVCISHGRQLLRDVRSGDTDVYDFAGRPCDLEGMPRDGASMDEDFRLAILRVHEVWLKASGFKYLGLRKRTITVASEVPKGKKKVV